MSEITILLYIIHQSHLSNFYQIKTDTMKLHTCVRPDQKFHFHIHKPSYEVANLRHNTEIIPLGRLNQSIVDNNLNYPRGNVRVTASDKVYEIANPFSFKGSTFINGTWANYQAKQPDTIHLPQEPDVSFSKNLSEEEQKNLLPVLRKLPDPVLLSLATSSTDPFDLSHLAEIACDLFHEQDKTFLHFEQTGGGRRAIIHNPHLFEAVANNPYLPERYKQAMVLRPGAQGNSEIVGEYTAGSHVFEYLRRNSYIPWGHYAANMANDTIRYSLADLHLNDMQGLRHLYYQRTYSRLAKDLDLPSLPEKRPATPDELDHCRKTIIKAIASGHKPPFDATLWGWNYGFDFAPTGYRLNASHQMIHQQFAMVPAQSNDYATFCCGDLIQDCCNRYQEETGQDFFADYLGCIRNNRRMDGEKGENSLILFEDEHCLAFIPKAQTSQWEVQLMTSGNTGNILGLNTAGRTSIDTAFYRIVKGLHKLGLKLMCTIEYSARFTDQSNQRLIYSFLPKLPKSPGAFSESQLRWIMGHFPEDFATAMRRAIG